MDPVVVTFLILGLAVAAFISGRIPVAITAVGVALALWATGILTLQQSLAGFSDPTVLFIASLFVVSEGLDATGVTARLGRVVVATAGASRTRVLLLVMLLVAGLTALISVNGAVAALLPMAVVVAVRIGLPPSQLLLPLAFAAHAGSMLTLTGTPVNVIISEFAAESAGGPFGFFEFALVGVPLVIGTLLITMAFGERMLPARSAATVPRDLSDQACVMLADYSVLAAADGGGRAVTIDAENGVAEVLVPPRSELVGMRVFPGMVTPSGKLVILAVSRNGRELTAPEVDLAVGDVLLLQGTWDDLEENTAGDDVRVVDAPAAVRGQAAPIGARGITAIVVLAVMIVLLATGVVPPVVAGLLAAGAMILTRVGLARSRLPRDLVDDGDPRRGHDPDVDGVHHDRRRRVVGTAPRRRRGSRRAAPRAARGVPARRRARSAHQQHGDRAHRRADRDLGCGGVGRLGTPVPHGAHGGRGRGVPHADRDARQPHGDGSGRLPLRRLRALRLAAHAALPRRWRAARAAIWPF